MLRSLTKDARVLFLVTPLSNLFDETGGYVTPSRPRFPILPELMLASALREKLPDLKLQVVNPRVAGPDTFRVYKKIQYFNRAMEAVRTGAPAEDNKEDIERADVVCISNNFTQNAGVTCELIAYVVQINPKALIIVGGADVAARYPIYLKAGADIACLAEGEKRLPALIAAMIDGSNFREIPHLAVNDGSEATLTSNFMNGKYLHLGSYPKKIDSWATDVNTMQFAALDLVDVREFNESGEGLLIPGVSAPIMHFESSRGCHESCTFCTTPNLKGTSYRHMKNARIRQMLEYYRQNGIRSLALNEDNLLSRAALDHDEGIAELIEMFEILKEMEFAWEFDGGLQFGLFWNNETQTIRQELFDALFYNNGGKGGQWIGAYRIYVPLERLADHDMKKFKKLQPFEVELSIIKEMARIGCPAVYLGIIVGVPTDTDETIRITRLRCQEIRQAVDSVNRSNPQKPHTYTWYSFFNEILLPGSTDWMRFKDQLAFPVEQYPELWNFHTSVLNRNDGKSPIHFHEKRYELSGEFNGTEALTRFREIGRYQPSDGNLLLSVAS